MKNIYTHVYIYMYLFTALGSLLFQQVVYITLIFKSH